MGRRKLIGGAALALVAGLAVVGACGVDTTAAERSSGPANATASTAATGEGGSKTIPQPVVLDDIPTAPQGKRVDLATPSFSDPTSVTNPLFPVSKQESVLMVGRVDGKPFRTEVTLLPDTRIIEWQVSRSRRSSPVHCLPRRARRLRLLRPGRRRVRLVLRRRRLQLQGGIHRRHPRNSWIAATVLPR